MSLTGTSRLFVERTDARQTMTAWTRLALDAVDARLPGPAYFAARMAARYGRRWSELIDVELDQSRMDQQESEGRHLPHYDSLPCAWQRGYDDHAEGRS